MRPRVIAAIALAAISVAAVQAAKRVIVDPTSSMPFSAAVVADGLIYTSGTLGSGAGSNAGNGARDIAAQTKQVLDRLDATLKSAGSSLANAVNVTVYLRNSGDFAAMNEVYRDYWKTAPPARTTVVVPLLNEGLVEIAVVAVPDGAERTVVRPEGWIAPPSPYSYGIKTGQTLFLAGLINRDGRDNTTVAGDMAAQTRTVLTNGAAVLTAAGMTLGDVVSARVFITDTAAFQEMNTAYRTFLPVSPPARATVKANPTAAGSLIEVSMVAVKGADRTAVATPGPDGSPATPSANLSSAIRVGNRLYVSGMLGNTPATRGDVQAQTTEALARIGRTLGAAGFAWTDVVDGVVYLPDLAGFAGMNTAYRAVFSKDFPARATVGAGLMGADGAVEIMFTAAR